MFILFPFVQAFSCTCVLRITAIGKVVNIFQRVLFHFSLPFFHTTYLGQSTRAFATNTKTVDSLMLRCLVVSTSFSPFLLFPKCLSARHTFLKQQEDISYGPIIDEQVIRGQIPDPDPISDDSGRNANPNLMDMLNTCLSLASLARQAYQWYEAVNTKPEVVSGPSPIGSLHCPFTCFLDHFPLTCPLLPTPSSIVYLHAFSLSLSLTRICLLFLIFSLQMLMHGKSIAHFSGWVRS